MLLHIEHMFVGARVLMLSVIEHVFVKGEGILQGGKYDSSFRTYVRQEGSRFMLSGRGTRRGCRIASLFSK